MAGGCELETCLLLTTTTCIHASNGDSYRNPMTRVRRMLPVYSNGVIFVTTPSQHVVMLAGQYLRKEKLQPTEVLPCDVCCFSQSPSQCCTRDSSNPAGQEAARRPKTSDLVLCDVQHPRQLAAELLLTSQAVKSVQAAVAERWFLQEVLLRKMHPKRAYRYRYTHYSCIAFAQHLHAAHEQCASSCCATDTCWRNCRIMPGPCSSG